MLMKKLAIISSHPIQYNAPMFRMLAERGRIQVKVFYTWGEEAVKEKFDPGFQRTIKWDIPLLKGYDHVFVENISKDPGSHHYSGIINPGLNQEIEAWGADAVLVFGWSFQSHLRAMRYFKHKIPVFFRGDSTMLDNIGFLKRGVRLLFLNWVYTYIDVALYVGEANKVYFKKHGLKNNQLVFAPHAVDNKRFAPTDANKTEAMEMRKRMGIDENALVYLFAGKFEEKKGPLNLLNAFFSLNHPNTHLIMVGNGILESALKSKAKDSPNVHFLDFQNQSVMPVIYQMCDVFILPSEGPGDTWGLVVNEAMAAEKAVIVSHVCGCVSNLVFEGKNGFTFRSGDEAELMEKMRIFSDDKTLAITFGKVGSKIIQDYCFEEVCRAIEELTGKK